MPLTLVTAPTTEPLTIAEAMAQARIDDAPGEPAPGAPTLALATPSAAGNVDNGAHCVGVTFVTAAGETELGTLSGPVTVTDKTTNGQLAVSAIPIGAAAVTARRLWLVPAVGGSALLAATISNNTATTATLNVADSGLGALAPTVNTTVSPYLTGLIAAVRDRAELATNRAIPPQEWAYVLDGFPSEGFIEIPRPPLTAVVSVTYVDTAGVTRTLVENTDYLVQKPAGPRCARGRVALPFAGIWPITLRQMGSVTIRFTAGYATVPGLLKQGMLIDLGTHYKSRESFVTGTIVSPIPDDATKIYRKFRSVQTQRLMAAS